MANEGAITKPIRQGMGLVRGSLTLLLMRIAGSLLLVAPAMLAAKGAADEAAQSAFFSEAALPMPANHFFSLLGQVLGAAAPAAIALILTIGLAYKFLLDGGAMRWFALEAQNDPRGAGFLGPWRVIFGEGWQWFWAMLRIAIVPGLLLVLALGTIAFLVSPAENPLKIPEGRTAFDFYVVIPGIGAAAVLALSWLTGALALQMRAVSVVNERKNTFYALWRGLGILARRPFQGTLIYLVISAILALLSMALVVAWRVTDPREGILMALIGAWLFTVLIQAYVWHWMARSAVLLSLLRDRGTPAPAAAAPAAPQDAWEEDADTDVDGGAQSAPD